MNRFWFAVLEGIRGLGRAKLAGAATIVAMSVALLMLGTFGLLTLQARFFLEGLKEKVDITVYLDHSISESNAGRIQKEIKEYNWVEEAIFISKEEAASRFKQDFGEDVSTVAGYNPLPPSYRLQIEWDALENASLDSLIRRIESFPEVTEVIYQDALLTHIRKYNRFIVQGGIIIGSIVSIVALFLVGNTIRLSIYSKRQIITLMELVGASRRFIQLPFLIEGAIQGLLGGICGAGLTLLLLKVGTYFLPVPFFDDTLLLLGGLLGGGIILGVGGSLLGLRRFLT